jgi:hypothetical protein
VTILLLKLAGSIVAILFLAWFARWLDLGGDVRIRSDEQAREIADQVLSGFARPPPRRAVRRTAA